MSQRIVVVYSQTFLNCDSCGPSSIILCVPKSKVAAHTCPVSDDTSPFQYGYIEGLVVKTVQRKQTLTTYIYEYTVSYDETQLSGASITAADVTGLFCKGCLGDWAEQLVGNESYIQDNQDGSFTFVSPHGCESTFTTNQIVSVLDTITVDLTLAAQELSANVNLSAMPGNALSIQTDGLFVPPSAVGAGAWWPGVSLYGDGSDGDLHVLNGQTILLPYPARAYYFRNLTIDAGGTLVPWGYFRNNGSGSPTDREYFPIFVSGTATINGTIAANGLDAILNVGGQQNAQNGPGGGDDRGGDGGHGAYVANGPIGNLAAGSGFMGGNFGGSGGDGGGNADSGFVITDASGYKWKARRLYLSLVDFSGGGSYICQSIGGGCGGGGGGPGHATGSAVGGNGGGGGGGAGSIYLAASHIAMGAGGKITANGGKGANGLNGTPGAMGNGAGGGAGGGGGGGGLIYTVFENLTGTGTIQSLGGVPGIGGTGVGAASGSDGATGLDGDVVKLHLSDGLLL